MAVLGNGRDSNRKLLYKLVPLSAPFSIGITPSDICNFRCVYCNQSTCKGIKDAKIITWDEFLLLANQIEDLVNQTGKRIKNIRFIGNGEPLLNKRLPDMISYLKMRNISDRYEVTTNGSLLTYEMSDRLLEAGITRLLVSVQGVTAEKYKEICGYNMDLEKFIDNITYFYNSRENCKVFIKTVDIALKNDIEKNMFFSMFSPCSDYISIENVIEACEDVDYQDILLTDNMDRTRYGEKLIKKICCDTLFMYLNVHSNGDVDCCGCKYPPLYIGNIYDTDLVHIWNGINHKKIMMKHLQKKRWDIKECAHCSSIEHYNGFPEDNLDKHLDEILKRVKEL